MSALLNAIDTNITTKTGENNHPEYDWSTTNFQERILQFTFQTVRCDEYGIAKMEKILINLIEDLQKCYNEKGIKKTEYCEYMSILYKLIGHTRDIIDGKGEYSHAYMHIFVWYSFFPKLAEFALKQFTCLDNDNKLHPYGSWKDIKYFCNYCKSKGLDKKHPLIQYCFKLLNDQLVIDYNLFQQDSEYLKSNSLSLSLSGKWVPRESSKKFGWMFQELACLYFKSYLDSAKNPLAMTKAILKCKMEYRKICSKINKELHTVQINMSGGSWASIDHSKTTSITISKQKKSFLNVNKDGTQRSKLEDRVICSDNFKSLIKKAVSGGTEIKGKRVGLNNMTEQALELITKLNQSAKNNLISNSNRSDIFNHENIQVEIDLLNSQWRDNGSMVGSLCNMIPMVDFSGSMDGDPKNCAYALGIRVAEKSIFGKRVLSFCDEPTWHNLDDCFTFVEMVGKLQEGQVGYSTNFYKALLVILDSIIKLKLTPENVSDLVLAIFSDMQINQSGIKRFGDLPDIDSMYQTIEKMYADTGIKLYGKPFKPPHILFWNLRLTSGFPCLSSQKNVSMMSGFSPVLLNSFCEKGIDVLKEYTPYGMLIDQLSNTRYECLGNKIKIELEY